MTKRAKEKGELQEFATALATALQGLFHTPANSRHMKTHSFNYDVIMRGVQVALRDGDEDDGSRRYIHENMKLGVDGLGKQWKITV